MMTREEAVERLKRLKRSCRDLAASMPEEPGWALHGMALDMAISALRPVSREQVEKVWRGEIQEVESYFVYSGKCQHCGLYIGLWAINRPYIFCPYCGEAFTDEAVEMVMERLEALKDGKGDND